MKMKNQILCILLLTQFLIGCVPRSGMAPTLALPTQTPLPFHPLGRSTPVITPSINPTLEKLAPLPPLSLPEFNARYSAGDIALSSEKGLMAIVSENKTYGLEAVWIWRVNDFAQSLFGYQVNVEKVWSAAFSPDGNLLAVGGTGKIILFDWQTGNIQDTISIPDPEPVQLVYGPNHSLVWSAFNNKVTVWDLSSGKAKFSVEGITGFEPTSFAVSPDGKLLVTGAYQGINLWDLETGQNLGFRKGPDGSIGIAPASIFSDTGQFLASTGCSKFSFEGCSTGDVMVWKSDAVSPSVISDVHSGWQKALAFSPDEGTLASASGDGVIELIHLGDGRMITAPSMEIPGQVPPDGQLLVKDIVFLRTGNTLAVSTTDGIQLLDVATISWMPNLRFILSLGYLYSISPEGDNLNFRTEPSMNAAIIRKLHSGESLVIIDGPKVDADQVWWKVKIEDDTEGWVVEMPGWYEFAQ